jgi:ribosome-associated protein
MISITPTIQVDEKELEFSFIHAPGPGGQNVNKVATAVQLRFNVQATQSIPPDIKQRLSRVAGGRMTGEGVLVIEARQYRSQERNRQAAIDRLVRLIQQASEAPKTRHKTRPSQASIVRRLNTKRRRGEIKRMRRNREIVE